METKEAVVPSEAERELWKSGDKVRAVRDLMVRTGASVREAFHAFPSNDGSEPPRLSKAIEEAYVSKLREQVEKLKRLARILSHELQGFVTKDVPNRVGRQVNCRVCETPQPSHNVGGVHSNKCRIGELLLEVEKEAGHGR